MRNWCGLSPAQVVFGRDVLQHGLPLPVEQKAEDAVKFHERILKQDAMIKATLDQAHAKGQEKQTAGHNVTYKIGQQVWVLRPKRDDKLSSWWTGPHIIVKQAGESVWEIDVGNKHRNVHEARMKPCEPPLQGKPLPLHHRMLTDKEADTSAADEWQVDKIIKHRT